MGYAYTNFTNLTLTLVQKFALERLLSFMSGEHEQIRILEIGVGSGEISNMLARSGFEIYAVDNSKECLEKLSLSSRSYLLDSNFPPFPFLSNFFDAVIIYEVIEHLWNPIGALQEINRIMKPSGKLLISTPNVSWFPYRLKYLFGSCPDDFHSTNHLQFWNWRHFEKAVKQGGFEVDEIFVDVAIPILISDRAKIIPLIKYIGLNPKNYYGRCYHLVKKRKCRLFGWDMVFIANPIK